MMHNQNDQPIYSVAATLWEESVPLTVEVTPMAGGHPDNIAALGIHISEPCDNNAALELENPFDYSPGRILYVDLGSPENALNFAYALLSAIQAVGDIVSRSAARAADEAAASSAARSKITD